MPILRKPRVFSDRHALRPLRSHLITLFLVAMAPLFLFALALLYRSAQEERATFERGAIERTRAMVTAVDTELNRSISTLEALAATTELDNDALRAFYDEAMAALKTQPDWFTIILATPDGQQVINLSRPFGSELPMVAERTSFDQVLRTQRPAIGTIFSGPVEPRLNIPVRVPVMRNERMKYVLTGVVNPQSFAALLSKQRMPQDRMAAVIDANQRIVARSQGAERAVGEPAAADLRQALVEAPEGWHRGRSLENQDIYRAYVRSPASGWTVAVNIPAAVIDAPLRGALLYAALSGLILLLLGVALALLFSKRTAREIESLAGLAGGLVLNQGAAAEGVPSRIAEVEHLREAFLTARRLLQERSKERDQFERELWEQASLLELSHEAIFVFEFPAGGIVYWNRGAEMLYGYSKAEAMGRSPRALLKTNHPRGMDFVAAALEEAGQWSGELVHIARDGRQVFVDSRQVLVARPDGKRLVLATNRDVSERRREDRRREGRAAVNAILAEAPTLGEATPGIVEALGRFGQWDMCNMWQWDQAAAEFVCVEVWHPAGVDLGEFEAETRGRRAKLHARMGLLGRVLQSGEPTWIADVSADSYYGRASAARKSGIHAAFCFPIKLGAEVLGFVECYSREIRAPDPDFKRALSAIGIQLGHFIERDRAEQALELVGRLPAENPAPVLRLKEGRVIAFANPAAAPLLAAWGTALGAEAPAEVMQSARAALADGRKRALDIAFDGSTYAVAVVPVTEANYVNLYFTDITDRRRN